MPIMFSEYFKEIAEAETRSITILGENEEGLPPGSYGFFEMFCHERNCDCRRVHFQVVADWSKKPIAMIAYGWEPPSYYGKWMRDVSNKMARGMAGSSLELLFNQSKYAPAILKLFERLLLTDKNYIDRVKKHYRMMRDAVDHDIEQSIPNTKSNVGRNDPCSCGSGKKYKKCCGI